MRITTAAAFNAGVANMQQRQHKLAEAQEQLTSGLRVRRASDDPTAAARAERAQGVILRSEADQRALEASRNAMALSESALADAGELLQAAREHLVAAGNTIYSDQERQGVAQALQGIRQQLLGVANRGDGTGGYLFGGQGASLPPFIDTPAGVQYRGAGGQLGTSGTEALPLTVDGQGPWLQAADGNGQFATANVNSAGAWIDAGHVTDPAAFSVATSPPAVADPGALRYELRFAASGSGGLEYSVFKDGTAQGAARPWGGKAIEFDGMAVNVGGTPADGDRFEVRLSQPAQSVFDTLDRAIVELRAPGRSNAQVTQTVQDALVGTDASMGALQSLRSRVGQSLVAADRVEERTAAQSLYGQSEKSAAQDIDMVKAISEFQARQSGHEAALRTYSMVQRLSLFDFLNG